MSERKRERKRELKPEFFGSICVCTCLPTCVTNRRPNLTTTTVGEVRARRIGGRISLCKRGKGGEGGERTESEKVIGLPSDSHRRPFNDVVGFRVTCATECTTTEREASGSAIPYSAAHGLSSYLR